LLLSGLLLQRDPEVRHAQKVTVAILAQGKYQADASARLFEFSLLSGSAIVH
jgi:hypothetical protein